MENRTFAQRAAKVSEEPKVTNAASCTDDRNGRA